MDKLTGIAFVTVGLTSTLFMSAWYAEGAAGDKYRQAVKTVAGLGTFLLTYPLGKVLGLAAALLAPLTPGNQPADNRIRWYRYQRSYKGTRYDGIPVALLIATRTA